jgi:hypothetical protein
MGLKSLCAGRHASISIFALAFALSGCGTDVSGSSSSGIEDLSTGEAKIAEVETDWSDARGNPDRNAYFGDLHVHTRYSFDAFFFGTTAGPDDAYRFAKGEPIKHPSGIDLQLDRPLDFKAVTDHAEYLGMVAAMTEPGTRSYDHPLAESVRDASTYTARSAVLGKSVPFTRDYGNVMGLLDSKTIRSAWAETIEAANRHYEPGRFTTLIGFEYTSSGADRDNLHRNVIFAGDEAPNVPFSRIDSANPEDLWHWMDDWRAQGIDSLAIPHNSNGSGGRMFERTYFDKQRMIDSDYAELRMRNEPLVEVTQVKGTSETHPALSPTDEWANFEIMPFKIGTNTISELEGSYVRPAYLQGLEFEEDGIMNPFQFGVIGSSDTHVAAGSYDEETYWAKTGHLDANPELRGSVPCANDPDCLARRRPDELALSIDGSGRRFMDHYNQLTGASGLAGVWAEENTREAIFAALKRKETFATSGPRIRVRFFALNSAFGEDIERADLVSKAYANGVPMGGEFDESLASDGAKFLVWAAHDPLGAPLQRLQVVKGWIENGEPREEVYDVACSDGLTVDPETHRCPDNRATVNLEDCKTDGSSGAGELKVIWRDPFFDRQQRAVYYVRVLENPTCRWSTWDAIRRGEAPRYNLPATIQERAWSSPIWYRPGTR